MDVNTQEQHSDDRIIFSLYINKEIARRFDELTRNNKLACSKIIEQLISDWLASKENNKDRLKPEPYNLI